MKAGLITFHQADNYGAVLQASALLKYINKNICACEIIDYLPNTMGVPDNRFIRRILRFGKRVCLYILQHKKTVKKNRFEKFRKKNYILSKNRYYGDEMIQKNPPEYDVLISGSDQILNLTLSKNSVSYYLSFADNTRKISYGSSFGRCDISETEEQAICKYLSTFNALSVREKSATGLLKKYIDAHATNVVDPVFLIDKDEWKKMADEKAIPPQKYIFVYAMENTEILRNTIDTVFKKYNLPIIKISGGCNLDGISGTEDEKCGPEQFLAYIKNAEVVITNSFHGMAFSHIFEKKFFAIAHTRRNSRIEDLLHISKNDLNIISFLEHTGDMLKLIDGGKAYSALQNIIEVSKEYLSKNIISR